MQVLQNNTSRFSRNSEAFYEKEGLNWSVCKCGHYSYRLVYYTRKELPYRLMCITILGNSSNICVWFTTE